MKRGHYDSPTRLFARKLGTENARSFGPSSDCGPGHASNPDLDMPVWMAGDSYRAPIHGFGRGRRGGHAASRICRFSKPIS